MEDRVGEDQAGSLTAETAVAAFGWKDVIKDFSEVEHPDIAFGHRNEVELVGEKAAHQGGTGALDILGRRHRLARCEVEELVDLVAQHVERRVGVLGETRSLLHQHSLLGQQHGGGDLFRFEVALGVLEGEGVELLF
jgi:hypothetical protein